MIKKQAMYGEYAKVYDLIYASKDYKKEAEFIKNLIKKHNKLDKKDLLEVACGTGRYLEYFKKDFNCTGLDLNEGMLKIAKKKHPELKFLKGDMINFNLNKKFDVVLCLFSSIGYVKTIKNLEKTIKNFSKHLNKDGVLIIGPWFTKSSYKAGIAHLETYSGDKIKIARVSVTKKKGNVSIIDFNFLVAEENQGTIHFIDRHELGLFEHKDILKILNKNSFKAKFMKKNKKDRGLFVGIKK